MSLWIVDIHGDIEGDYEIVRKYEEPESKWIPTSERLPNVSQEEDEMLITLENKDGERDVYKGFYDEGLWWVQMYCGDHKISLNNPQSKVVAWMPLPEPYKAESEETE